MHPAGDHGRPAIRHLASRRPLLLQEEQLRPQVHGRQHAEVAFAERGEPGDLQHGVGTKVVRLQPEEVEEVPEEKARGKAKAALEVREEDDVLARLRLRHPLRAGTRATSASAGGSRFVRRRYRMFSSDVTEPSHKPFGSAIGELRWCRDAAKEKRRRRRLRAAGLGSRRAAAGVGRMRGGSTSLRRSGEEAGEEEWGAGVGARVFPSLSLPSPL